MSSLKNSSKVVGNTFVVTLIDLDKDVSSVSFALTKNNDQFCFLATVSNSLTLQSCEPNNVFIHLPKSVSNKISLKKSSHSISNWSKDVKSPLRRLDFKGFFELLDRRSKENAFVFVLEKLHNNELKDQFEDHNVVFQCNIRDGELGKIKNPIPDELTLIKKGNFEVYNKRLVDRLACNICHFYKWHDTDTGYTPECRPFNCYHYYHGECLETWKSYHLQKNNGIVITIKCSLCQSNVRKIYDDLYACEWKIDGSGEKIASKIRIEVLDTDDSDDVQVSDTAINNPNFKQKQKMALTRYKNLQKANEIAYQEFMKNNKVSYLVPDTKRISSRVSSKPDRYGQNKPIVKHVLLDNENNMSSAISVITIDKSIAIDNVTSAKKKRNECPEINKNNSVKSTKKSK